jgi:hypothetical protein
VLRTRAFQTPVFKGIGLAVDLLLCAHASLSTGSCAAIPWMGLKKFVFFEALDEFANVTLHNVGTNAELAADFLDDLCFRPAAFQHSKDFGAHDVQNEHLALLDVEDDSAIALVSAANSFGNLQQGVSPSQSLDSGCESGQRVPRELGGCHSNVSLFANQE